MLTSVSIDCHNAHQYAQVTGDGSFEKRRAALQVRDYLRDSTALLQQRLTMSLALYTTACYLQKSLNLPYAALYVFAVWYRAFY